MRKAIGKNRVRPRMSRQAAEGVRNQRFGAHMSIAGGLEHALEAGEAAGCDCVQIFVKNQRQWSAKPLSDAAVERFKAAARDARIGPVIAHATYLINLAAPDASIRTRSVAVLVDEVRRCARLGVPFLVVHPGAHKGDGVAAGIKRIASGLDAVHRRTNHAVSILLETAAGQGSSIGHEVEHLSRIMEAIREPGRVGVCVDTCHVFAAGYDIRREDECHRLVEELDTRIGPDRVGCIHVNDSKGDCGSRVDRHEHIGQGKIGRAGFRNILNNSRLVDVPRILETPKGKDGRGRDWDRENLRRLRSLIVGDSHGPSSRGG